MCFFVCMMPFKNKMRNLSFYHLTDTIVSIYSLQLRCSSKVDSVSYCYMVIAVS